MLIKQSDNRDSDIAELQKLLARQITTKQRFLIEREIKCLGAGVRGEETSAYYIDFHFKGSKNWAVIHDLRVRYEDFTAQIDHLLINRCLDIYVLESKNYYYGTKITTHGEFMLWNGKAYEGIESPIEQNLRHVRLLEKVITRANILPTRLGFPITPEYHNYVLIAPTSRVDRPSDKELDTRLVIKADALVAAIQKRVDEMRVTETFASATKMVSSDTLETFARELAKRHRSFKMDYAKKFGVSQMNESVEKCASDRNRNAEERAPVKSAAPGKCSSCGTAVDSKVLFFCRMNKKTFDGRTLCRECQVTYTEAKK